MKKVLALALALVMVLSMGVMGFAEDATAKKIVCGFCKSEGFADADALEAHIEKYHPVTEAPEAAEPKLNTCPLCDEQFADEALYNAHIKDCKFTGKDQETVRIDLTVKEILNMIIDLLKSSMTQWGDIESIIIRIVDFVENMGGIAADKAAVLGAVEDLEASLADVKIPGLDDLLNQLKAKIKAMYAGEKATTVEETTVVTPPADTGSSAAGIAAFAAISVAAAAAYVCTKKSK